MPKKSSLQPKLTKEEPTSYTTAKTDALAHLRRPLTKEDIDKVRHIEGFPIGTDEDIIALSDAPYYTACPNPFLEDFIHAYGKPYDEATDTYHREPFATDVSEGKGDAIYNIHGYHTKVPHKAIMRYILHYTEPGDIVFDGFCGTGMTGVAAQVCGDPDAEIKSQIETEIPKFKWGARRAVLCDLSPAATFIAKNYNAPVNEKFIREVEHILTELEKENAWMYETLHTDGKTKGRVNYTVWSDVFLCQQCGGEIVYWDEAVDVENGKVREEFSCPHCGSLVGKRGLQPALEAVYDSRLDSTVRQMKQQPVRINYSLREGKTGKSLDKRPSKLDLALIARIKESRLDNWYPTNRMPLGDEARRNDDIGITHSHHFYTTRNLIALSKVWAKATDLNLNHLKWMVTGILQRASRQHQIAISRIGGEKKDAGGKTAGHRRGTLYVPSNQVEFNVFELLQERLNAVRHLVYKSSHPLICTGSATETGIPGETVDYIFVDPPFGDNIMYSELNFLWESWLRVATNSTPEAVINRTQQKALDDYLVLMTRCFKEFERVLKPSRWLTVEFHNSKNAVWNAIQEAILRAGFVIADVRTLDKQKVTHTQVTAAGAVKQDLVISAYKPSRQFEQRFLQEAGTEQGAWDFIRQHLAQLPVFVAKDDAMEIVAERQNYLLFDRMVAFHIQRGASVPISAAEFYAGLRQRFPERDGMYFTSDQVAEYDTKRAQAVKVEQLALFVSDEKSAVQWLRVQLEREPQTYQDIQPKFLRELHQARHEQMPELSQVLEENFLKDAQDRWYVPDPAHAGDLEKLRERGLLREFESYVASKGKLKTFRTEAVRAGFKSAWSSRNYATIIEVARRLPDDVLQEDAALLMYYDNAVMRVGAG